jgi:hypothetical protein
MSTNPTTPEDRENALTEQQYAMLQESRAGIAKASQDGAAAMSAAMQQAEVVAKQRELGIPTLPVEGGMMTFEICVMLRSDQPQDALFEVAVNRKCGGPPLGTSGMYYQVPTIDETGQAVANAVKHMLELGLPSMAAPAPKIEPPPAT